MLSKHLIKTMCVNLDLTLILVTLCIELLAHTVLSLDSKY